MTTLILNSPYLPVRSYSDRNRLCVAVGTFPIRGWRINSLESLVLQSKIVCNLHFKNFRGDQEGQHFR